MTREEFIQNLHQALVNRLNNQNYPGHEQFADEIANLLESWGITSNHKADRNQNNYVFDDSE